MLLQVQEMQACCAMLCWQSAVLTLPTMLPPMSCADCIFGCVAATWAVTMSLLCLTAGVGLAGASTLQQINVDLGNEGSSSPCSPHTAFSSS